MNRIWYAIFWEQNTNNSTNKTSKQQVQALQNKSYLRNNTFLPLSILSEFVLLKMSSVLKVSSKLVSSLPAAQLTNTILPISTSDLLSFGTCLSSSVTSSVCSGSQLIISLSE